MESNSINDQAEIRRQEESKGGLSFEVILAEPSVPSLPSKLVQTEQAEKIVSADEIARKLREAEERRICIEKKKVGEWSAKVEKIEKVGRKKDEFAVQTKEALEAKMNAAEMNRETMIAYLMEKLKNHFERIEINRINYEQQKNAEREAIDNKLKAAVQLREENIKKMLERLNEHNTTKIVEKKILTETRANEIKTHYENKLSIAEQNREREIQKKLENARKNFEGIEKNRLNIEMKKMMEWESTVNKLEAAAQQRDENNKKLLERLNEHNSKNIVEKVTAEVDARSDEIRKCLENKLTTAEQNREKEIQKKLENVRKHELHAQVVREKAALNKVEDIQVPITAE